MPTYNVIVFETLAHTVQITADNDDNVVDTAYEIIEAGNPNTYTTVSLGTYDSNVEEIN